jgi:predicted nucleic acid-binding Zn ribbon protein
MVDSGKEATKEARKRDTRIKTTWYCIFVLFNVMHMLLTGESWLSHGQTQPL